MDPACSPAVVAPGSVPRRVSAGTGLDQRMRSLARLASEDRPRGMSIRTLVLLTIFLGANDHRRAATAGHVQPLSLRLPPVLSRGSSWAIAQGESASATRTLDAACGGAGSAGLKVLVDGVADLALEGPQCPLGRLAFGRLAVPWQARSSLCWRRIREIAARWMAWFRRRLPRTAPRPQAGPRHGRAVSRWCGGGRAWWRGERILRGERLTTGAQR